MAIEKNSLSRGLFLITIISVLFGGSIVGHIKNAMNPYIFNDDVRQQIVPFYTFYDPAYKEDYIDQYYLNTILPCVFKYFYKTWSHVSDPVILSKLIPYIQLVIFLLFLYLLVYRWTNFYTAVTVLLLSLSTEYFFSRGVGGLPRSFAFPILSAAFYYLAKKKWRSCAVLVVLGGCFYPMIGVVVFVALSVNMLFFVALKKESFRSGDLFRKVGLVSLSGMLFLAACLPNIISSGEYGGRITKADLKDFPEAGIGGRYIEGDLLQDNGMGSFLKECYRSFTDVVPLPANPEKMRLIEQISTFLRMGVFYFSGLLFLFLCFTRKLPEEMLHQSVLFFISITLLYFSAILLEPHLYFPSRYIQYTVPLFFLIMVVVSIDSFFKIKAKTHSGILTFLIFLPLVIASPGKINKYTGYSADESRHEDLYRFISTLPENAVILGWPDTIADNIPYLTKRKIYYGFENHHAFHKNYTLSRRELARMNFDIYLSQGAGNLKEMIKKTDARYVLVEKRILEEESNLSYFSPFDAYINHLLAKRKAVQKPFALIELEEASIFNKEGVFLLDLN